MYRRVIIPTRQTKRIRDLLGSWENGIEVGSLAYVKSSPYKFVRTKALQNYAYITQFKGDAVIPITAQAYAKATRNQSSRVICDGDTLYARGGAVGEVVIAEGCDTATFSSHILKLSFSEHPLYCLAFMKQAV